MPDFTFLHAADLHIDSAMRQLTQYEHAPIEVFRNATRKAFENLVTTALEERVGFVVLAGDLFDDSWRDYNTGVFFGTQLARLAKASIPVFILRGNHDSESEVVAQLSWPDNVRRFSATAPETYTLDTLQVKLHGQSFLRRETKENLAVRYPMATPGWFNIGVLHTALSLSTSHAPYAPCTEAELAAKGYDYWALGHVHERQVVSEKPWIVFPGNLQGRSVRETGPRGATLVSVKDGKVASVVPLVLDVVRWAHLKLDATGLETPDEIIDALKGLVLQEAEGTGGRPLAVRLEVTGRSLAFEMAAQHAHWRAQLLVWLQTLRGTQVWLEKLELGLRAPPESSVADSNALAQFKAAIRAEAEARRDVPKFETELLGKVAGPLGREDLLLGPKVLEALRAEAVELAVATLANAKGGES